jgi:hypothetical protein
MIRNKCVKTGTILAILSTFALVGCLGNQTKTVDSNSNLPSNQGNPSPGTNQDQGTNSGAQGSNSTTAPSNHDSDSSATSSACGQTNVPVQQRTFPTIIRMAMENLGSSVLQDAKAPTVIPADGHGSTSLFYETSQSTASTVDLPGFLSSYKVKLNSPTHLLADYSETRYDTTANATLAFQRSVGDLDATLGTKSTVDLGHNVRGTLTVNPGQKNSNITWFEGRWQIRVSNDTDTTIPMVTANQVVEYLETHFMPVPNDKAAIMIDLQGSNIHTGVIWQEQRDVYLIDTYTPCYDSIRTALAMTISMRSYP